MKSSKLALGLLTGVLATTGLTITAYGAGPRGGDFPEGLRADIREITVSGDYDTYVAFARDNDLRVMDQDRFDERSEHAAERAETHDAVLDGDYDAWRDIVGDEKMTDVDQDNFYLLTDMAQVRESGDEDAIADAKTALEDAGIEPLHNGRGKRPGHGNRGDRDDRDGEVRGSGEQFGIVRDQVADMSDDEKQDLLERIINQIRERLGLD